MNRHIVMVIFVVEDQENVSIDDIKHQFAYGIVIVNNKQGEAYTYEPKSVSVTTVNSDMSTDTKVYGYD